MSRILLIGVGPLPAPGKRRLYAPGLRLEAFLGALERAGCDVFLGEIFFSGIHDRFEPREEGAVIEHRQLSSDRWELPEQIAAWTEAARPDALVALTDVGALGAVLSGYTGPMHADYFGHPMAERQQLAAVHESNAALHQQWLDVLPVLLRADRFSANSPSQRLALLGELGAAGRINAETCGRELVEIIPPTLPFDQPLAAHNPKYLEEKGVPPGARVVLSTGGYNTWVDEETLFLGVEEAMRRDNRIHFVSTGGAIEGHVEVVYTNFCKRIEQSEFRDRFHLLGWVPQEELFDVMHGADAAVNSDRWSLEGELGCRNRLFGWLWAGLRVVTTVTSDPTKELAEERIVHAISQNDPQALARGLVEESGRGRLDEQDLEERQALLRRKWGAENHFTAFTDWARDPKAAPDRQAGRVENPLAAIQRAFLDQAASAEQAAKLRQDALETAERLLGSRAVRMAGRLNPEILSHLRDLRDRSS